MICFEAVSEEIKTLRYRLKIYQIIIDGVV